VDESTQNFTAAPAFGPEQGIALRSTHRSSHERPWTLRRNDVPNRLDETRSVTHQAHLAASAKDIGRLQTKANRQSSSQLVRQHLAIALEQGKVGIRRTQLM
jgi:hypothetical protein